MEDLTVAEVLHRIRFDSLAKKGSVLDTIQLVTGCGQSHACHTFRSITDSFPEVMKKIDNLKFPGRGQKPTPCAHVNVLMEIAFLCPGRHAKQFRTQSAVTLCRALGGDLTLVDEVMQRHAEVSGTDEQAALLEGTGVPAAEANVQAIQAARRTQLENDRYEQETFFSGKERAMALYNQLIGLSNTAAEERDKLFFADAARNLVASYLPSNLLKGTAEDSSPVTLSTLASELGMRLSVADLAQAGRLASQLYRQRHGHPPPKHKQFVDGAVRLVNSYTKADSNLLKEALSCLL